MEHIVAIAIAVVVKAFKLRLRQRKWPTRILFMPPTQHDRFQTPAHLVPQLRIGIGHPFQIVRRDIVGAPIQLSGDVINPLKTTRALPAVRPAMDSDRQQGLFHHLDTPATQRPHPHLAVLVGGQHMAAVAVADTPIRAVLIHGRDCRERAIDFIRHLGWYLGWFPNLQGEPDLLVRQFSFVRFRIDFFLRNVPDQVDHLRRLLTQAMSVTFSWFFLWVTFLGESSGNVGGRSATS